MRYSNALALEMAESFVSGNKKYIVDEILSARSKKDVAALAVEEGRRRARRRSRGVPLRRQGSVQLSVVRPHDDEQGS
jgi:hypothetical protein